MQDAPIPNFFIAGAPRCGTSSMYVYLKQHPDIFMSPVKEPMFFGSDLPFINPAIRRKNMKQYLSLFEGARGEKVVGEASTCYFFSKSAPQEIKEFNPSARVLIILRNPPDMMHSLYHFLSSRGEEDIVDFEGALDAEEHRKNGRYLPRSVTISEILFYKEIARYVEHIKRWFDVFGRSRVQVILFDDLRNNTADVYSRALLFLGIDNSFRPDFSITNASKKVRSATVHKFLMNPSNLPLRLLNTMLPYRISQWVQGQIRDLNLSDSRPAPLNPEFRKRLQAEFAPDVDRLSHLLDRDLSHWCR